MKKSNKLSKQDKNAITIVGMLVIIFMLIIWGGIKSKKVKILEHYVSCEKICAPNKMDVERSNIYCRCIEEDNNEAN